MAAPVIPAPSVPCAYDPGQLCNTDAETAGVIGGYAEALATANRKLCWLAVFFGWERCAIEEVADATAAGD